MDYVDVQKALSTPSDEGHRQWSDIGGRNAGHTHAVERNRIRREKGGRVYVG